MLTSVIVHSFPGDLGSDRALAHDVVQLYKVHCIAYSLDPTFCNLHFVLWLPRNCWIPVLPRLLCLLSYLLYLYSVVRKGELLYSLPPLLPAMVEKENPRPDPPSCRGVHWGCHSGPLVQETASVISLDATICSWRVHTRPPEYTAGDPWTGTRALTMSYSR